MASMGMHAADHRDWHALALSEGVNAWDCPFDCIDLGSEDEGPAGPPVYAYVINPNLSGNGEYPVFSKAQARLYAETLAVRLGNPGGRV